MAVFAGFAAAVRRFANAGIRVPRRARLRSGALATALALVVVLPLAAGCGALGKIGAGAHNPPAKSFTISGRVSSVVIHGGSGSVDVTGTAKSTVSVSQQLTYSDKPPTATRVLHGGTLTVSYTCPTELVCGVSYHVQVPRGVPVSVTTSAGAVTVTSLTGAVTAKASAGLITAVDLSSPVATFNSNAGGVVATFATAPRSVTATTNLGPITLTVPNSVGYLVAAQTVVGTATVTVRRSGSSAHSITARSDVGSISINPV
jgi:hypothetical protein